VTAQFHSIHPFPCRVDITHIRSAWSGFGIGSLPFEVTRCPKTSTV